MKEKRIIGEANISDWRDIFLFGQHFLNHFIFRGQADSAWPLVPSLERHVNKLHDPHDARGNYLYDIYEYEMIEEFQRKYPMYEKHFIPKDDNTIEWLAIMQHYGVPTRMLDFSHSLGVALYIGVSKCENQYGGASIWMLNKDIFSGHIFERYSAKSQTSYATGRELAQFNYTEASNRIRTKGDNDEIFIVEPKMCFERISHQQSVFVMPSNITIPFQELFSKFIGVNEYTQLDTKKLIAYSRDRKMPEKKLCAIKLNISFRFKYLILKELETLNITAEILFSGIDGLCKHVSRLRQFDPIYYSEDSKINL